MSHASIARDPVSETVCVHGYRVSKDIAGRLCMHVNFASTPEHREADAVEGSAMDRRGCFLIGGSAALSARSAG